MRCDICKKEMMSGHKVSHSNIKTNRRWQPNVQRVKAVVDGRVTHIHACTRCLRSGKVTKAA